MITAKARFGLTLPNRGVVIGATTVTEMLEMAGWAEDSGWDSVWVGDSILAKPRLDALVLLGALAARTRRVRLGPACFASTPLRDALTLAYQWASLDLMSNGRMVFVACQGQPEPGGGAFDKEFDTFGIEPSSRMRRTEEAIEIMRFTSSREHVDYDGQYNHSATSPSCRVRFSSRSPSGWYRIPTSRKSTTPRMDTDALPGSAMVG
jgi:alkanesulfonate monooxygenase SsuD/methylene tetrahydromethanopterin reductase-like flavin-dependent oxidoreductase (luciferase family)